MLKLLGKLFELLNYIRQVSTGDLLSAASDEDKLKTITNQIDEFFEVH